MTKAGWRMLDLRWTDEVSDEVSDDDDDDDES